MTKSFSNRITGCLMFAAALLVPVVTGSAHIPGTIAPLAASGGNQGNPGVSPPNSSVGGRSYAEWSVNWWRWSFSLDLDNNPTSNPAAPCTNGQSGHTWYLYGGPPTVNCTVPPGTAIFIPVVDAECSSLDAPPFHGDTAAERGACAKAWVDYATDLFASIDGVTVQNLASYRVASGDFYFTVPANAIPGIDHPASGFSSADGYYLYLPPLSAGSHTIRVKGTFHDPFDPMHPIIFPLDTTIQLTVGH